MKELIKDHFDKLLLAAIVMYLVHVVLALAWKQADPATIAWARELTSGFGGGLLGLITGMRVGQKIEQDRQRAVAENKATE